MLDIPAALGRWAALLPEPFDAAHLSKTMRHPRNLRQTQEALSALQSKYISTSAST
jgi:hypothetical protein